MSIEKQIEDLQYQIKNIDGHTKIRNIGNRFHGALEISLGAMCAYLGTKYNFPINIVPYAFGFGIITDGIGTLLTGKLHYVLFRATKVHPKYKLEKLTKIKNAN